MDEEYQRESIAAAITKINKAGKPLSESELIRGMVHLLKKKLGGEKNSHTSKSRFRRDVFRRLVEQKEWKEIIVQLPGRKFDLRSHNQYFENTEFDSKWNWKDVDRKAAQKFLQEILKGVDPYKFEHLVKAVLEAKYPEYNFNVTKRSGDKGIDVVGTTIDTKDPDKKELFYVQAKRHKATLSRPEADKFVGAFSSLEEYSSCSKIEGLFICTGKYSDGFIEKIRKSSSGKINFLKSWDGQTLIEELLRYGIGLKYSVDRHFWTSL